jgi:hypothetical protein
VKERCKDLIGKRVALRYAIRTKGGRKYEKGSFWIIKSTWRGTFELRHVTSSGDPIKDPEVTWSDETIRHVRRYNFEVVL